MDRMSVVLKLKNLIRTKGKLVQKSEGSSHARYKYRYKDMTLEKSDTPYSSSETLKKAGKTIYSHYNRDSYIYGKKVNK